MKNLSISFSEEEEFSDEEEGGEEECEGATGGCTEAYG
jgi:hypothetical protein